MANLKINQLSAATAPLPDDYLFPVAEPVGGIAYNVSWADMKAQVIGGAGIKVYYVDGNNTSSGDGSVTNPFQTLDQAYTKALGTGTTANPQFQDVTIEVAAAQYTTAINIWLNNVSWNFAVGTKVQYTGVDYFIDTAYTLSTVTGKFFVVGDLQFSTSTGGFVRNIGEASTSFYNKYMVIEFASANGEVALGAGADVTPFIHLERSAPYTNWSPPTLIMFCKLAVYSRYKTTIYQDSGFFVFNGTKNSTLSYGMSISGATGGDVDGAIFRHVNPDAGTRKYVSTFQITNVEMFGLVCITLFDVDGNLSKGQFENISMVDPGAGLTVADKLLTIRNVTKLGSSGSTNTKFFLKNFHMYAGSFVDTEIISKSPSASFDNFDMEECVIPTPYTISSDINLGAKSVGDVPIVNFNIINGYLNLTNVPVYASNAAALLGGLIAGDVYTNGTGSLNIVY